MRLTRTWTSSSSSTTRMRLRSAASLMGRATLSRRRDAGPRSELDRHLDARHGPVAVDRRLAQTVGDVHSLHDLAEDRELTGEARLIAENDEELLSRAVRVLRTPHGRDHSTRHRPVR